MSHSKERFESELLAYSVSDDINKALKEWDFVSTFKEETHCICGTPIIENCVIENKKNQERLIVGNTCIKKFLNQMYNTNKISIISRFNNKMLKEENLIIDYKIINKLKQFNYVNDDDLNTLYLIANYRNNMITKEEYKDYIKIIYKVYKRIKPSYTKQELIKLLSKQQNIISFVTKEEKDYQLFIDEYEMKNRLKEEEELLINLKIKEEIKNLYLKKVNTLIDMNLKNFNYNFINNMKKLLTSDYNFELTPKQYSAIDNTYLAFNKKQKKNYEN